MQYQNFQYNYTMVLVGRAGSGKTAFLMSLIDRSDIKVLETMETSDYVKTIIEFDNNIVFTIYKFYNLDERPFNMDELVYSIALLSKQVDYIVYFIDNLVDITDFDRWVINKFNMGDSLVHTIANIRGTINVKPVDLIEAGSKTGVKCLPCNCTNSDSVGEMARLFEKYSQEENDLYDLTKYLETAERIVVFVEPISMAKHLKSVSTKYFELMKSVAHNNGKAIYLKKEQLKGFFHICSTKPDVILIGNKIMLNVTDIDELIK